MSHFSVMVIGSDPESQLAPYHEFECTGIDDEYVQDVDITEDVRQEYERADKEEYSTIRKYCEEYRGLNCLSSMDNFVEEHKYGYFLLKPDGELDKAISRTNPNAKWDWYSLGGRWTGYFKLKSGRLGEVGEPGLMTEQAQVGYADAALKKDIDFDGMRHEVIDKAAKKYDTIKAILDEYPGSKTFEQCKQMCNGNIDGARAAYNNQPVMKALEDAGYRFWLDDILEECNLSRDEYLKRAGNSAITSYAFVKDGEWVGSGDMGWWGISTNNKDENAWNEEFNKMLDSLPDDTMLSLYDCHI